MTDNKKNIPKHWKVKKLEEAIDIQGGSQPPKSNFVYEPKDGYIQLLQIRDFGDKGLPTFVPTNKVTKFCKKEDILIARYGASLGRIVTGLEGAYNVALAKVIDNDNNFIKRFIYYLLQTSIFQTPLKLLSRSAQNGFSKGEISDILLPIPPLSEQKAIVEKIEELFSELDKGIEELRTAQDQLKVYRQGLLKWAFEGKLTNNNVEEGKLPKGWKRVTLGDIVTNVEYGSSAKSLKTGKIPVMRMGNIQNGRFDWRDLVFSDNEEEIKKYLLKKNDVLFNRTNSPELVGKTAIYKGERPAIFAGYLIRINRIESQIDGNYLTYYLNSHKARCYGDTIKTFGVNQANINGTKLKTYPIPLAPLSEQQKIIEILEEKLSVCDQMEQTIVQSLQQAESLRQSILKQAFEGKLVTVQEETPAYAPKKIPFYQAQLFGYMIATSANNNIDHGEMTLAKNSYLIDKIYGIPTYFDYGRGHLGPYSIEMKNVLFGGSLKQFFKKGEFHIELQNSDKLFKYSNPYEARTKMAMEELSAIFSQYDDKERSYQTELLATVCKVIEDIQTTDLKAVRTSMKEWKIDLKTTKFKNKAEKFSESDTASCLNFVIARGWDKRLIN